MLEIKVTFTFVGDEFDGMTIGEIEEYIRLHLSKFIARSNSYRMSGIEVKDEEVESDGND